MRPLTRLTSLLRNLFRRQRIEKDLDEELSSYLAQLTKEKIAAGMTTDQARRQAQIELGGLEQVKEQVRDIRAGAWLDSLLQDLRYALRTLRKNPTFTAIAVLTLGLGIGANTAIFTLLNAVMLGGLHVRDPHQLVLLQWHGRKAPLFDDYSSFGDCANHGSAPTDPYGCSFSSPMFDALQHTKAFASMMAFAGPTHLTMTGSASSRILGGEIVSGDYFETLGVRAALGRVIQPADDSVSASNVVVLKYSFWQDAFGAAPSVVGTTIHLNGVPFTIVGVAEPGFSSLAPGKTEDLWLARSVFPRVGFREGWSRIEDAGNAWLAILARLKPGISPAQAKSEISLAYRNEITHGSKPLLTEKDDPSIALLPARDGLVGAREDFQAPIYVLMLAVGIILLITCANVAGLMVSRSSTRHREIAVRVSLGASRMRVVRQLLTECMVIATGGGLLATLFAHWGVRALIALVSRDHSFPFTLAPDVRVFAFTAVVSILCGILFGLAPALGGTRIDLAPALKENVGSASDPSPKARGFDLSSTLVVAQIALAVVILAGAGLLVRTLINLRNINPGFDSRNVLIFGMDPPLAGYNTPQVQNLYRQLQAQFASVAGVISVSYSSSALLSGNLSTTEVAIEGQPDPQHLYEVDQLFTGLGFFDTMRIPILAGRVFNSSDIPRNSQPVASSSLQDQKPPLPSATAPVPVVINDAFARRYFARRNPLGMHLQRGDSTHNDSGTTDGKLRSRVWEIAGVVGDAKYDNLRHEIGPTVYLPLNGGGAMFEVRTAVDPALLIPAIRDTVTRADANLPLFRITTESQAISHGLFRERLIAQLSGFFGLLALMLACVGVYGLLSYDVSRRTREFGIRTAIGAQSRSILAIVLRRGLQLSIIGTTIGFCAAFAVTRYVESLLYGVHHGDAATYAAIATVLLVVVLAACYLPARRATRIDPMVALRHE